VHHLRFAQRIPGSSVRVFGADTFVHFDGSGAIRFVAVGLVSSISKLSAQPAKTAEEARVAAEASVRARDPQAPLSSPKPPALPVALACTGLPPGSSCKFGPASLPAATANTDLTVEVITTAPKMAMNLVAPSSTVPSGMAAFFALPLLAGFGLRRRLRVPLACLFLVSFSSLAACSSDAGSADSPTDPDASIEPGLDASALDASVGDATGDGGVRWTPTPNGTYPFKVTAALGAVTTSLDLTLTVQ
jgi:hypothetical protein